MTKTMFIFAPSKYWHYCGGIAIAVTDSYQKACKLIVQKEGRGLKFYLSEPTIYPDQVGDLWVLAQKFEVEAPKDFVLVNYNYA